MWRPYCMLHRNSLILYCLQFLAKLQNVFSQFHFSFLFFFWYGLQCIWHEQWSPYWLFFSLCWQRSASLTNSCVIFSTFRFFFFAECSSSSSSFPFFSFSPVFFVASAYQYDLGICCRNAHKNLVVLFSPTFQKVNQGFRHHPVLAKGKPKPCHSC